MSRPNTNFENKKLELIKIAFDLFLKKGYEETTISDILKASGISKGGMYHYFDKKEDILDAVLNYIIDIDEKRYDHIINDSKLGAIEKIISVIKIVETEKPIEAIQADEQFSKRPISIFDYRSKKLSARRSLKMLSKIIKEGVESKEFNTIYPNEIAESMVCFTQNIYENINEKPSLEKLNKEVDFFIYIFSTSLGIEQIKVEEIGDLIKEQLKNNFCL